MRSEERQKKQEEDKNKKNKEQKSKNKKNENKNEKNKKNKNDPSFLFLPKKLNPKKGEREKRDFCVIFLFVVFFWGGCSFLSLSVSLFVVEERECPKSLALAIWAISTF